VSEPDTDALCIDVDLELQQLTLKRGAGLLGSWPVSTASNGAGERSGSECTPRGIHEICEKVGAGSVPGTVFVGRKATGERYSKELALNSPGRDWILTRILWLAGCEPGRNAGGVVDTKSRYIYIHGSPDSVSMGIPGSHGCIRMRNSEVCALFDRVEVGTKVVLR